MRPYIILFSLLLIFTSCNEDARIISLMKGQSTNDKILGAFKAGESGKKKFVPYLLDNAADVSTSVNIQFKGFTVYEEKMAALQKIFKKDPPVEITHDPDSAVIKFYMELARLDK